MVLMRGVRRALLVSGRRLHSLSRDGPSDTLKRRVEEMKKMTKKNNPKKDELFVEVPESRAWLDTASLPLFLTVVGTALFAKLLMLHDDSKSQEMIERKIKNAPPDQGTVRMLTREEWEEFREVRPRTPFESKLARPNARIRTGESVRAGGLKDWTVDVLTNALTCVEESAKHNSSSSIQLHFPTLATFLSRNGMWLIPVVHEDHGKWFLIRSRSLSKLKRLCQCGNVLAYVRSAKNFVLQRMI